MRKAFELIQEDITRYEIVANSADCWSIYLTMTDGHVEERMIYVDKFGELKYSDH